MNENNLTEIEMEKEGLKIRLKKSFAGVTVETQEARSVSAVPKASEIAESRETPKVVSPQLLIKSPMVGTFYASPAPDAPPFVQVGSQVETGQVICIIEAMKLMNEIKSEIRGKIAEILVNNGDPVEFNQSLFRLE